jgi:hypothetical protein
VTPLLITSKRRAGEEPVTRPLPLVLDWIEAHAGPENKLLLAQFAMQHPEAMGAIVESSFERKEDLMLQLVSAAAGPPATLTTAV